MKILSKSFRDFVKSVLLGQTSTDIVSGKAVDIVFNRSLSNQVYEQMDCKDTFTIQDGCKSYIIKRLITF